MANKEKILRCSFCGKSHLEAAKLIAGPTVYICNECVEICNEILADEKIQRPSDKERTRQYLEKAISDIEAACTLFEAEHFRAAVDVARNSAHAALYAFQFHKEGYRVSQDFTTLLTAAFRNDTELRRLHRLRYTELITHFEFDKEVTELDAKFALDAANRILKFVRRSIKSKSLSEAGRKQKTQPS